ncbi:MAG: hypothetical protein LBE12_18150 [Planctomycetaceae bacterium]|jgi:ABC-type cobalamin transport system permease subunit|nr:hypothetical protein [Planctomycetaceae bacterium]
MKNADLPPLMVLILLFASVGMMGGGHVGVIIGIMSGEGANVVYSWSAGAILGAILFAIIGIAVWSNVKKIQQNYKK